MNDKMDYFITETNKRFDKIECKLDQLISFRLMLIGASITISTIVSLLITFFK